MKSAKVKQICKQAFDQLAEALEQGKSPQLMQYLKAMGRFHKYSLYNSILISLQNPEATHVAGFSAWQKLGRHVKKGHKGIAIMAPILYRKAKISQEGEKENKEQEDEVFGYRTVYVWDVSQTNGKPLPEFSQVNGDPGEYLDKLKQLVRDKGITLKYSNNLKTCQGFSAGGTIVLNSQLHAAEEFSTLVHELAHELMHRKDDVRNRTIHEVEAEAVAFVVCHGINLESNTASRDYIQLYDGNQDHLMDSLTRIQGTAAEILRAITSDRKQEEPLLAKAA